MYYCVKILPFKNCTKTFSAKKCQSKCIKILSEKNFVQKLFLGKNVKQNFGQLCKDFTRKKFCAKTFFRQKMSNKVLYNCVKILSEENIFQKLFLGKKWSEQVQAGYYNWTCVNFIAEELVLCKNSLEELWSGKVFPLMTLDWLNWVRWPSTACYDGKVTQSFHGEKLAIQNGEHLHIVICEAQQRTQYFRAKVCLLMCLNIL